MGQDFLLLFERCYNQKCDHNYEMIVLFEIEKNFIKYIGCVK